MAIETIIIEDQPWFKITDIDRLRPFFMNIVSDSNHWMFISSNGGLTAGRKNSDYALFPYYTDDKITESADVTGSKTIFQIRKDGRTIIWEPFSERFSGVYRVSRNLYKSFCGNKLKFEETNQELGLTFSYEWNSSNLYGFVRKAALKNESGDNLDVTVLDGIQNIMPAGVEPDMQTASSNLVDAYKKNELIQEAGLGIYALSAIIVDKAEPSEALKANVAWSIGFENPKYLMSSLQLNAFRLGEPVTQEEDIRGEKGAYFLNQDFSLAAGESRKWKIIANVNLNHAAVIELCRAVQEDNGIDQKIEADIRRGTRKLKNLVAAADGLRLSDDKFKDARHFSNVLFNIMRGGTFDHNYDIEKKDFSKYLAHASKEVYQRNESRIEKLEETFDAFALYDLLVEAEDPDFFRLAKEYLPLKFSRRHGDPSRPWNRFSINTKNELDGSKILDYEGNWRDIFQNWEALVHAYPRFIEGMIFKFLNASTFDGYNPYRVTKSGFDWEIIEPDNPWSYIGYWGDHQVIYLLKFLEFYQMHHPKGFDSLFRSDCFAYANVPYRIQPYEKIARDPKNTIDFDLKEDQAIRENIARLGADGALLQSKSGDIHRVNFLEKILAVVLSKLSNFVPEAGIWMNTQRPEWNDANNALVGNGVSMVTLYYLHRFLKFFSEILEHSEVDKISVSEELGSFFQSVQQTLNQHRGMLAAGMSDSDRKRITDALGMAGSDYRWKIYKHGFNGTKIRADIAGIREFMQLALQYTEHSIKASRRADHLYHAYNIITISDNGIKIGYLDEMLEGQVAVLSSGFLDSEDALKVLDALRNSALYRADQNSYMLYPDKNLPRFLDKNLIPESAVNQSQLLQKLVDDGNPELISRDVDGGYHFNGDFRNVSDVKTALGLLRKNGYAKLVDKDEENVLQLFENVFNHKAFTGRSGTFFAYEGLGSIYWHMVSKLYLAAAVIFHRSAKEGAPEPVQSKLAAHFHEIGDGIGIHKTPEVYGAFPTDPYSHTPGHRGAQQPGMTGQVKEDILSSRMELGLEVEDGMLNFRPRLLRDSEFLAGSGALEFPTLDQELRKLEIGQGTICFSIGQVPVIYQKSDKARIEVILSDGKIKTFKGSSLDRETSSKIFNRSGLVKQIIVFVEDDQLHKST